MTHVDLKGVSCETTCGCSSMILSFSYLFSWDDRASGMEQTKLQCSCVVDRTVPSSGRSVGDANSSTTHISAKDEYVRYSDTTQDLKFLRYRGGMSRLLQMIARQASESGPQALLGHRSRLDMQVRRSAKRPSLDRAAGSRLPLRPMVPTAVSRVGTGSKASVLFSASRADPCPFRN